MERWKKRAVTLSLALSLTNETSPSVIPYFPQKTELSAPESASLPRATPESSGISSLRIMNMLSELESERRANIHNIIVIRRGAVISEASAPGYSRHTWHLSHSMTKTLTGMAIGLLVDDGVLSISEKVADIFPDEPYKDSRFAELTVEHLLSMKSGVPFSEIGVVTEDRWTEAFFGSDMAFAPGEKFAYNSMNSYILGKIAEKKSGQRLSDLISKRIFAPLGIRSFFFEKGPEGIDKGGFGAYLSAESWAKLGLLMLHGGVYAGRRILSQRWIAESITTRGISPESSGDFNYGYHIWVHRQNDEFLFNGMLGQNVWVCPRNDTVVVINAGNNELFQQSPALYIVRKYLAGDIEDELRYRNVAPLRAGEERFFESRRYARPLTARKGLLYFLGIKNARPYDSAWNRLLGKYIMRKNNDSLLPIFVRCMQNNLACGIESIHVFREGEGLFMTVTEGKSEKRLQLGLYGFAESVLDFNGELYKVMACAEASYDTDGKPMFRIELAYPELPNTRYIELSFAEDGCVLMKLSERPNSRIAEPFLESLPVTNPKLAFARQMLERRYGSGFLASRLERIFCPSLLLIREDADSREELLRREEDIAEADNRTVRSILSLVERFIKDAPVREETYEETERAEEQGFFGSIIKRFTDFARPKNTKQP